MGVVSPFAVDATRVVLGIGLPLAMTWHCMLARTAYAVSAAGVVRRWAGRGVAMSAVSEVAAAGVRIAAGVDHPVAVLPNGIDVATWQAPIGVDPANRPVRIVTAMRLARRKRPGPFLDMMREVRERVPSQVDLRVEIFGEGPDRGSLERYADRHRMSGWLRMPGRVPRTELPLRYARSHVYVAPAELESFGIAALEARTAGLPVVARLGSGVGEFVTSGVNGFLAADDDELVARLAELVTDQDLRRRMTAYNREHPPAQDWSTVVDRAVAEYKRARG